MRKHISVLCTLAVVLLAAAGCGRQPGLLDIGVRPIAMSADGSPANDMLGGGVYGRLDLPKNWKVGAAIDQFKFDFENSAKAVGLQQATTIGTIDNKVTSLTLSGWIERILVTERLPLELFLTGGIAFASLTADDAAGPLAGGGTFDVRIDDGIEYLLLFTAGARWKVHRHFGLEAVVRLDNHFGDWDIRDTVSGNTGKIETYFAIGAHLGVYYRF